jgi:quercetin dioxygenase-like cupin family protein
VNKQHFTDVPASEVPAPAVGVKIRWLIDANTGAPHFAMRHFEIAPGGNTPLHTHGWEHEVFILGGSGVVAHADGDTPFAAGDVIFMPGDEEHQFRNTGSEPVTMLCLVPQGAACGR